MTSQRDTLHIFEKLRGGAVPERAIESFAVGIEPQRDEIKRLCDIFRGSILDVTSSTYVVEITGEKSKLDAFLRAISEDHIIEVVRSGTTGILRGERGLHA